MIMHKLAPDAHCHLDGHISKSQNGMLVIDELSRSPGDTLNDDKLL